MQQKKCDIVIVTYNRRKELIELLRKLKCQSNTDFNIIISDDGSRVEERINPEEFGVTEYMINPDTGYHRPLRFNEGIEKSVSEYIILLDDDLLPKYNTWFITHIENLKKFDISRGIIRFSDNMLTAHGYKTSWFTSCNVGFKTDKLKSIKHPNNIGGFDINFDGFYGHEDCSLGESCKELKYTASSFINETECLHRGKYYKNGDRSDSVVKHNRDYFLKRWGYSHDKIDGRKWI